MTRLIAILVVAGFVAAGVAWFADNDGSATLLIGGYEFSASAGVAIVLLLVFSAVVAVLMRAAAALSGSPTKLGVWATQRRAKQFFQALSHGLVAAAAGDAAEAGHFARRSDKLLKGQPLSLLLNAQAAHLAGDHAKEEAAYRAMLNYPETEFLGLRGLYGIAMRRRDEAGALAHVTRAYALKPKAWAMNALFDLRVSRRDWREAISLVVQATRAKALGADVARRRRAVLLAAQAVEAERAGDASAQAYALEALALSPGLTAAALIAARHLAAQGRAWKAQAIIEAAWAQTPHRELAEAFAAIKPDEDIEARANRLLDLARLNALHRESRVLMAEQFVALRRWDEARNVLAPLAEDYSSARVCNLMAMVALGEDDVLTAQLWRSRAARAGRVSDWRCSGCSAVASEWGPVCPQCGAFDLLNWSTPESTEQAAGEIPASVQAAVIQSAPPPARMTDEQSAARNNVTPYAKEDSSSRFPRLPDDPGPGGGQPDIFEGEAEDTGRKTRQQSG